MDANKTFIKLGNELLLLGKDDDSEMTVLDPTIRAVTHTFMDGGKFGARKMAYSPIHEHMITANYNKSIVAMWSVGEKNPFTKVSTLEKLTCLAISADGILCLGGGNEGFVFIWNACSGEILTRFKVAAKPIFKISISCDDLRLVVSTNDSKVQVYNFDKIRYDLMKEDKLVSDFSPISSFYAHKKGLTDVILPKQSNNVVITASGDCTVKKWEIGSSTNAASKEFMFDKKVTAIAVDDLGLNAYVGLLDGSIYKCHMGQIDENLVISQE